MNYKLVMLDVRKSFVDVGSENQNLISTDGRSCLSSEAWISGNMAYQQMKKSIDHDFSDQEYANFCSGFELFLDEDFIGELKRSVDAGNVDLQGLSKRDLEIAWRSYDWSEKAQIFFQVTDQIPELRSNFPLGLDLLLFASGATLLWKLDQAMLAEFFQSDNFSSHIFDIAELRGRLSPNLRMTKAIEFASNESRKQVALSGAKMRHALDPKQADKASVRECWDDWQNKHSRYKSNAAFARDMLQKYEALTSQPVIERWCREWKKESST